jgi:hypothetical protein
MVELIPSKGDWCQPEGFCDILCASFNGLGILKLLVNDVNEVNRSYIYSWIVHVWILKVSAKTKC